MRWEQWRRKEGREPVKDVSKEDSRLCGHQVVGWRAESVPVFECGRWPEEADRSRVWTHSLVWVSWCLTNFDR